MEFQQALCNLHNAQQKQKKRQKRNTLICIPVGFLLGLAIFMLDKFVLQEYGVGSLGLFIILLLTLLIQLILHEAGHLVFGLFSGYRFVSFRVFSFVIYKKDGRFRFGRYRVPGTMGQCFMCPTQEDNTMPYRALLLGGVIVNAASALLFILPLVFFYQVIFLRFFSCGMIFWGIVLALTNGIPQKSGAVASDGYHVKVLPTSEGERRSFFNQLRISAAMTEGKRLAEMPKEWFVQAKDQPIDPMSATLTIMEAEREMDLGRLDQAQAILLDLATRGENLPESHLSLILSELLYLEMVGSHRRDLIETLRFELDRFLKLTQYSFTTLRIEMTYHYLFTGDLAKIQKLEKRFEKGQKHFPLVGESAREKILILYPKALYENWRNAPHN